MLLRWDIRQQSFGFCFDFGNIALHYLSLFIQEDGSRGVGKESDCD